MPGAPFAAPWRKRRPALPAVTPIAPAAPDVPSSPSPADTATAYYTLLSWVSARATKFDIYLDTVNPPVTIVVPKYNTTSYVPTLAANTTYYWKIVAFNDGGSATGPVWSFTTPAATAILFSLAGTIVTSNARFGTLSISDVLGPSPNTGRVLFDTPPTAGAAVAIGLGTLDKAKLIFGGEVQAVDQTYVGTPAASTLYPATLIDYTFQINKRRPFGTWTTTSASTIARYLVAVFAPGFTATHVQDGLPAVSITFDGSQDFMTCLRALAAAISDSTNTGKTKVDYAQDVWLYLTYTGEQPDPIDNAHPPLNFPSPITFSVDHSQVRTRCYGKGHGETIPCDVAAGETILPIADAVMFTASGGQAIAGATANGAQSQILSYTGVQLGGGGSLVGPGVAPSTAPTATTAAGTGLSAGTYQYAYTDVTAAGESLPSPLRSKAVTLTLPTPAAPTGNVNTSGSDLSPGIYQWACTFVNAAGETDASPILTMTTGSIADPTVAPTLDTSTATGSWTNGTKTMRIKYFYRDFNGTLHTALSPDGGEVINNGMPYSGVKITGPCSADSRAGYVEIYISDDGVNWYSAGTPANVPGTNWTAFATLLVGAGTLSAPTNNYAFCKPQVNYPIGPASTTARKIYRTVVGGSQLKLSFTVNDNTNTGSFDTTPDGSLGANAPASNTATSAQVALSGIAVGPSGTTQRKVYRTEVNASQLRLLTTLPDNTTTTATDSAADASLGANAPSTDTSGLTQPTGQVLAGASTCPTSSAAPFSVNGGWAQTGNGQQVFRYTGLNINALTGIPTSGPGSIAATISYNATITPVPALVGINQWNGVWLAMAKGSKVNIWVQRDDLAAQAALGALELDAKGQPTDGIREYTITDERSTEATMKALCDADLAIFSRPIVSAVYHTRDPKSKSGRTVSINLTSGGTTWARSGDFTIQHVELSFDGPALNPRYAVTATSVAFTLSDLLRHVALTG